MALATGLLAALGAMSIGVTAAVTRPVAAAAPDDGPLAQRVEALKLFRTRRYAEAYGRFVALADGGDEPAALMALLMVGAGPAAFDSEWSATSGQLRRCEVLAAQELRRQDAAITQHERGE